MLATVGAVVPLGGGSAVEGLLVNFHGVCVAVKQLVILLLADGLWVPILVTVAVLFTLCINK